VGTRNSERSARMLTSDTLALSHPDLLEVAAALTHRTCVLVICSIYSLARLVRINTSHSYLC